MASLMCCCAPNKEEGTAIVDASGELTEQMHMAASLQHTSKPNFPAPVRSSRAESGAVSPRSRTKESEKVRLQEIVRDFSRQATSSGISVHIVSAESAEVSQTLLTMDKYLHELTLKTHEERQQEQCEERCFNMKDMSAIHKGPDFTRRVPSLAHMAAYCVGVEFVNENVNFHFKDTIDRDQFYTCLKILRMSVDINSSRR